MDLSSDQMEARLSLFAQPAEPYPFSAESILQALRERNVIAGVLHERIQEIVNAREYVTDFLVAKGTPPEAGTDARIELLFDPRPRPRPLEIKGRVDWHETHLIQKVAKDQPVARKVPSAPGSPGLTVAGKRIEPCRPRDVRLRAGRGTKISENDPNLLVAAMAGSARLVGDQVVVDSVLSIPGDVDFSIGNISFDGAVHVAGNVLPGFSLSVTGDISVDGFVEASCLESGGSIWIGQGLVGRGDETWVRAAKDVVARIVNNATITAGGSIIVQGEAMNSHLNAGDIISVGLPSSRQGRMVGGQATAAQSIQVVDVGSPSGTDTTLIVTQEGISETRRELQRVTELIAGWREKQAIIMAELAKLMEGRVADRSRWTESQQRLLDRLAAGGQQIEGELHALEDRAAACRKKLSQAGEPRVVVLGTLFPGVQIGIGSVTRRFHEELTRVQVVLTEDSSSIVTVGL